MMKIKNNMSTIFWYPVEQNSKVERESNRKTSAITVNLTEIKAEKWSKIKNRKVPQKHDITNILCQIWQFKMHERALQIM